jgi:hypothetical protein
MLLSSLCFLETRISKLETLVTDMKLDQEKLILRSFANQMENKLARLCLKGTTAKEVEFQSIGRLQKMKKADKDFLKTFLSDHTDDDAGASLESGVAVLKELGGAPAHRDTFIDDHGNQIPIDKEKIEELLNKHFSGKMVFKDMNAVLRGMLFLQQRLGPGEPFWSIIHS